MAVILESSNSVTGAGVTSLTVSVTTANSDRLLLAGIGLVAGTPPTISSVTYNTVALTEKWNFIHNTYFRNAGYYLIAPASGANNLVVNFSGAVNDAYLGGCAFSGVHQTTPLGTHVTNTGSTTTATVDVSSATDEIVWDNATVYWTGMTVGTGQTSRYEYDSLGSAWSGGGSTETGSSTTTMSWTKDSGGSDGWGIGAVGVKPTATSGLSIPVAMNQYRQRWR